MKCDLCKQTKTELVRIGVPDGTLVVCKECAADVYVNNVNEAPPERDTSFGLNDEKRPRKSREVGE